MLKKIIISSLIACSCTFVACTSMPTADQQAKNVSLLQNTNWVLTHIGAVEYKPNPNTRNVPTIQFNPDLVVRGSDGCNRLAGVYAIKGEHITLSQLGSTRMYCEETAQLAQQYSEALGKVKGYQVYDKTLKLLDQHGNRDLQYSAQQ